MTSRSALTHREEEILNLFAKGLSDKAIAAQLGIGRRTVSNHVVAILLKLDAVNRTHAVSQAYVRGLIAPGGESIP